jgi:thiamine pyrophosphate-dependent acetolactate synthase large subunit-like protein
MQLDVGIGLAKGKNDVCFFGGSGSLFSIRGIWAAARYRVPAIFI